MFEQRNVKKHKPLVSVIVPIFNAENSLSWCIDSVCEQSFTDFELILINDGSTDKSKELCDYYAKKDARIKVFSNVRNRGVSAARNWGLKISLGDYIVFVDSDDWLEGGFLKSALTKVREVNADWYICGFVEEKYMSGKVSSETIYSLKTPRIYHVSELLEAYNNEFEYGITSAWGKVYISKLIRENNLFFDEGMSLGEDTNFNLRYLMYCSVVLFDNEVFYHYIRGNLQSLSNFSWYHESLLEACEKNAILFEFVCKEKQCGEFCITRNKMKYCKELLACIDQEYFHQRKTKEKLERLNQIANNVYLRKCNIKNLAFSEQLILTFLVHHNVKIVWAIYSLKHIIWEKMGVKRIISIFTSDKRTNCDKII